MRRGALSVALLVALACLLPGTALLAQTPDERLRQQREQLERIRRERDSLQTEARELQGRVTTLAERAGNLARQAEATARLVRSLDAQLASITTEVKSVNENLERTEAEAQERRQTLRQRVRDIYKRGPLFAAEALLSARSFGELVARYRYLHELALYDRAVVRRVEELYAQIEAQRQLLVRLQEEFARNREEKVREQRRLRDLEAQQRRALAQARQSAQQVEARLAQIRRDEARVAQLIASFEAARRRGGAAVDEEFALNTSDFGRLNWPVDGDILYHYGRAVNPNNTAIRWNGIGIAAPLGSPVRAIADGEVVMADPIGTYGLTVIVQHGGDYSVYGSLQRAAVRKGTRVTRGDVIGYVGRADPDMEPHLHFEIRPQGRATDPLEWLQKRSG